MHADEAGAGGVTQHGGAAQVDLRLRSYMGAGNNRDGLIVELANEIPGSDQYDRDTAGSAFHNLNHAPAVLNNLDVNGMYYHLFSMLVDMMPYQSENVRKALKVVAMTTMQGASIEQLHILLRRATSSDAFINQASLYDKVMLEVIIDATEAGGQPEDSLYRAMLAVAHVSRSIVCVLVNEIDDVNKNAFSNSNNSTLVLASNPVATPGLKIIKSNEYKENTWSAVNDNVGNNNNMAVGDVLYCAELGKMRFDTKLVRNLTWMVNLQRIMRVIMVNHLSHLNTPVIRGLKIANPKVTEFEANEKFEESDFNGEDYTAI